MTPRITGLDHVQLAMPSGGEEAARRFYGDLLGLREVEKPEGVRASGGVWFSGPAEVHLGIEADFRPARKAHPCFTVAGYEGFLAELRAAGHETTPDDRIAGSPRSFVHDPFGNRIELRPA
jgi:catechol 2,3-dioxygenase-like lactoylglutathione lyase family enzyme